MPRLEQHLVRTWTSDVGVHTFTRRGWHRLIAADDTRYWELILEIVTCTLTQRKGGDKVAKKDLRFLWALLRADKFFHLLYLLVEFLIGSAKPRAASPLVSGNTICIAESYDMLPLKVTRGMTPSHLRPMGATFLLAMNVIIPWDGGNILVGEPQPAQAQDVEMEAEIEGAEIPVAQPEAEIRADIRRLECTILRYFGAPTGGGNRAGPSGTHHDDSE
ncbi:hypothetical protein L1887_22285 [Cichorium endivia]|nr:hypothetical protein L1887_22285 [Cichorium endivia]